MSSRRAFALTLVLLMLCRGGHASPLTTLAEELPDSTLGLVVYDLRGTSTTPQLLAWWRDLATRVRGRLKQCEGLNMRLPLPDRWLAAATRPVLALEAACKALGTTADEMAASLAPVGFIAWVGGSNTPADAVVFAFRVGDAKGR